MEHWPQIQDTLCPAGVPNTTFATMLFSVARAELGISTKISTSQDIRLPPGSDSGPPRNSTLLPTAIQLLIATTCSLFSVCHGFGLGRIEFPHLGHVFSMSRTHIDRTGSGGGLFVGISSIH